jgi:hypothetical protein
MRQIHAERWEVIRKMHRADTQGCGHRLQLAVAIGNAYGTNVISFDQKQLNRNLPVLREFWGICSDRHSVLNRRGAGRQQSINTLHFHDAQATSSNGRETLQIAECGDVFAVSLGSLQNRLPLESADQLAVDSD